jgi:hypothetical protein
MHGWGVIAIVAPRKIIVANERGTLEILSSNAVHDSFFDTVAAFKLQY